MGVVALTVTILPGLLLLAMGLKVRRRGETPFCGRCGYNLTGRASDVCPECGSDLAAAGAVVHGTAHRRRGLIVAGGVLLAVAAAFVIATLADVDWYRLRPTAWVIRDTQTRNWADAGRAWLELDRRDKAGKLTADHHRQLVDVYLRKQTWPSDKNRAEREILIDYVSRAYKDGLFTDAQRQQFFSQLIEAVFEIGPRTSPHDPVSVQLKQTFYNDLLPVACTFEVRDLRLDGEPLDKEVSDGVESFSFFTFYHPVELGRLPPGQHELTGTLHVAIYASDFHHGHLTQISFDRAAEWSKRPCYYQGDNPLIAKFEVLSEESPDYIRKVASDDVERIVRNRYDYASVTLHRGRNGQCSARGDGYKFYSQAEPFPVNVAADVYLRLDGREFPIGLAMIREGEQGCNYIIDGRFKYTGPAVTKGEMVLRSNEQLARDSLDLYEIWEGEVVHENIFIAWEQDDYEPTATRPGS